MARGIGRPPPVYLTLNKLSYLILSYLTTIRLMKGYPGSAMREMFAQLWNTKSNEFLLWHP